MPDRLPSQPPPSVAPLSKANELDVVAPAIPAPALPPALAARDSMVRRPSEGSVACSEQQTVEGHGQAALAAARQRQRAPSSCTVGGAAPSDVAAAEARRPSSAMVRLR